MISADSLLSQTITKQEHQTVENVTFGNDLQNAMVVYSHVQCTQGNSHIEKHSVWHRPVIQRGRPWRPNNGKHNVWRELQKLGLEGSVLYLRQLRRKRQARWELDRARKKS